MIDYRFIKEHLEAVKKNIAQRNMRADADAVVSLFEKRTKPVTLIHGLQECKRNEAKIKR